MGYIYKQTERGAYPLWTVGTYDSGQWDSESDHNKEEAAAERARYLNGGNTLTPLQKAAPEMLEALEYCLSVIEKSDHWWINSPGKGGFDQNRIEAIVKKAKGE